jgi:D-hydroxyproline dehydrogenase subunit alpha
MKHREYDIAIIGAGFSGLVAAGILREYDLDILLLEESGHPGGQYLRTHPLGQGDEKNLNTLQKAGLAQIQSIQGGRVNLMTETRVLGIDDNKELLLEQNLENLYTLRPEIVLLAPGAREQFVPFKGWTLPGVISTGALQIMLKGSGVLPADNIIIGGSGLFLYTVAADVIRHGGRVSRVFDENSAMRKMGFVTGLMGQTDKFKEGMGQLFKIAFSRTKIRHRYRITEACGEKQIETVRVAKIDPGGRVVTGSESEFPCECLAIGNGFTPNIELGLLAGCTPAYDTDLGGWIITTDENLETNVAGIFAAGETTGIGGAEKSIAEGKLAAYSILQKLGKIDDDQYREQTVPLQKERKKYQQFACRFNALGNVTEAAIESIPDDTILCRCEDITVGEVKKTVENGCKTLVAVKRALRTGMGICQGRTCGPVLSRLVGMYTGTPVKDQTPLSIRWPVKAVPLEVLAKPISQLHP